MLKFMEEGKDSREWPDFPLMNGVCTGLFGSTIMGQCMGGKVAERMSVNNKV
jgi:hypothetical protein